MPRITVAHRRRHTPDGTPTASVGRGSSLASPFRASKSIDREGASARYAAWRDALVILGTATPLPDPADVVRDRLLAALSGSRRP